MSTFKRGYIDGEQTIEVYEGKIDLVLYNDKPHKPSFYFYRFKSEDVIGEPLSREVSLVRRQDVEGFLQSKGLDYNGLIEELLHKAWSEDMNMRDEM